VARTVPSRLLLVVFAVGMAAAPAQVAAQAADPDRLYDAREVLASARAAADAWSARLAGAPDDFDAAWKLARAAYWLGSHVPDRERRAEYERGLDAGRRAIELEPNRPEGRFWLAATMGAMAESFGLRAGIRYRGPVKRELEAVLKMDPAYLQGAADRALGRWYFRVPRLFGGSRPKAIEHLQRSLTYDPFNAASNFFLAEVYLAMDREDDARRHLGRVLEAPETTEWGPEVREFKRRAQDLLNELEQR
jgi:tetratricopeptide (TPR) repeat protein